MFVKVIVIALFATVSARRFCQTDDDCTELGDITCQFSRCDTWGICGCPRGTVARFMGSEKKFQCPELKKIGEGCSEDGSNGVCGPDNSFCDGGTCKCNSGMISVWDGEKCLNGYEISEHFGETCSASLGQCGSAGGNCDFGTSFDYLAHSYEMPICACGIGERLYIPNEFSASPFVGRREPMCINIKVGDKCMRDSDCGNIGGAGAECVSNVCTCTTNSAPRGDGSTCSTATLSGQGTKCYDGATGTNVATCGLNMECGDVCSPDAYYDTTVDRSCECMQGYSGGSCSAVTEGSVCKGDAQCWGIGYDALCLEDACVAGAAGITFSIFSLLFAVFALFL